MNRYICLGNLTADPQVKDIGDNKVCSFSVAINSISKKEDVFFMDVECWNKVAENCAKYLNKGSRVLVEGKLKLNSWTSKDGTKREKFICSADLVTFLNSAGNGSAPAKKKPAESEPVAVKDGESDELEGFDF
jgi:single-strand DNA-binding protein